MSELKENITSSNRRFQNDTIAQNALNSTMKLEGISASQYDAVFFPGGHGPMFDLASNELSGKLILDFLSSNKPVASVCHGPAALIKAAELDSSILIGKTSYGVFKRRGSTCFKIEQHSLSVRRPFERIGCRLHLWNCSIYFSYRS